MMVVLSQIFGGAGLAAGLTVGALLARDMMGTDSGTGIPTALFTLGSAAAALIVGRLSQRFGRRFGLAAGFLTGGIGAIGVIISALTNHIPLFFASLLIAALVLLGLGWNFGLISGTALIVDATHPSARAKTQGAVDVLIALSGSLGGGLSGMVVVHSSYSTLSLAGALLSLLLILIPIVVRSPAAFKVRNDLLLN